MKPEYGHKQITNVETGMKSVESIVHKKLRKSKKFGVILGWAYPDEKRIEIHEDLKGVEHLEVLIHEIMHLQKPTWAEMIIRGHSKEMAKLLWEQGYRRVEL